MVCSNGLGMGMGCDDGNWELVVMQNQWYLITIE